MEVAQCEPLLKSAYQNPQTFEQVHLYTKAESKMSGFLSDAGTLIFASHSEELLKRFCSRGLVFERGTIVFDGLLEMPGRIIIITTNHPEKIDKALLRPGRIDRKIEFKKCTSNNYSLFVQLVI